MLPMEMMATLSLPGSSSLGSALLTLLAPACEPSNAPAPALSGPLVLAEAGVGFGTVFEGRILTHEWRLAVQEPVAVSSAKTDCGCTLARLEREGPQGRAPYEYGSALAPGEHLRVAMRYDTRGRQGPTRRAVNLLLDRGAPVVLHVTAEVRPWLALEPSELAFARVVEGEGAEREFSVLSVGGEPFGLQATGKALPPWVTIDLEPLGPDTDGRAPRWNGRVRLGEKAPRGTFDYPLELVTDVPIPVDRPSGDPTLEVPTPDGAPRHFSLTPAWTLQVVGPVALSSPTLEFGLLRGDEVAARSLLLESFDPAFAPDGAVARLEPLEAGEELPLARTARVRTRVSGQVCEIELVFDGLDPAVTGSFLARLVVETGHPALPRLEALVRGVRAPEAMAGGQKP